MASAMNAPPPREVLTTQPPFREFVALIASVMAMIALAIDAMLPALPAIGDAFAIVRDNDRQYVIGAFMIGIGLGQLYPGTLSDRFGRRPVLLLSLACFAAFNIAAVFAPSFETLLAARFAAGLSAAGGRVVAVSIVRDRFVGRQMARVMSLAMIVFLAAPILAPALGQIILAIAPWRWIFVALGLCGLAVAIWAWARLPESLAPSQRVPLEPARIAASARIVLGDRQSVGYTVAAAFLSGGLFGFINSVQQIFADVFGRPNLLAPAFALIAGTMAIGSFLNSRFVERHGMRLIGHGALIAFTLTAALHLAVAVAGAETIATFALIQAATMACFGLCVGNFGALAMEKMGGVAGTASSLQGFFSTVMGALLGLAIGQGFDGTTVPLYTGLFLCAIGALAAVLVTEHGRLFRRQV